MNLTHTGILGFDADFAIPVVSMTAEDQGQLERYVNAGITPRARFNIQNMLRMDQWRAPTWSAKFAAAKIPNRSWLSAHIWIRGISPKAARQWDRLGKRARSR